MNTAPYRIARYLTLRALSLCFCAEAAGAAADTQVLRIGTLAPAGTSFHTAMQTMAFQWKAGTNGKIRTTIFAGGKYSESQMVDIIKYGNLEGALLTGVGLSQIEPGVAGMQSIPMGFHSLEEVDYVGRKLRPMLEARLAAKGYIVLFWVDAGWVRFFSKKPVLFPDDLRNLKLFSWAGNTEQTRLYKLGGFDPVEIDQTNLVSSMTTGMIQSAPVPPFFAMSTQLDSAAGAKHMLELNWAPLVGAFVVSRTVWEGLPASTRALMQKTGAEAAREITLRGRKESDDAVAAMVASRGLKVTKLTPEAEAAWLKAAEGLYPEVKGKLVPADVFEKTMGHLKDFRAGKRD